MSDSQSEEEGVIGYQVTTVTPPNMAPIAAELRARGLPVEVVGLGGLLDEPEVADLVSTLKVLADPLLPEGLARILRRSRGADT